jgi:predicted TIM-barrel fold metal-dependent hydrolase
VFSGVGEFSIHKEFVSPKVAGELASLTNPALDRIFEFCAETGLIVLLHSDIDMPFAKPGGEPMYLAKTKDLLRRHPRMNIIWAHTGLGRIVQPRPQGAKGRKSPRHVEVIKDILTDKSLNHVYFDISWDEVAKYVISAPDVLQRTAALLNQFPDRFLFGTDNVAPKDAESYFRVYEMYQPLWDALTPEASSKIRKDNYERLFDAARKNVRAWERANIPGA